MMAEREFLLPDLGEGLEEAEILSWRVSEGDTVELNQPLVEVNTAKAVVEIPSPFAGRISRLHGSEGEIVAVGAPLVTFEVASPGSPPDEQSPTEGGDEPRSGSAESAGNGSGGADRPKRRPVLVGYGALEDDEELESPAPEARRASSRVAATPPVRRLAKDLGVDLALVKGSGPQGRVTREDVEQMAASADRGPEPPPAETPAAGAALRRAPEKPAAAPPPVAAGTVQRIPVRGTRRLIAEKMAHSVREIPHVTTFLTVDAHYLQLFRQELASSGERVSPLAIVVKTLAEACGEHPKLNASFDADASEIVLYGDCHVGIATDTDRGLVVTVVKDAANRGILDIQREIASLSEAARAGTLAPDQMAGSTITVSNVGTFGAEFGTPIINYPEAAILATGLIEPRALVVEGRIEPRPAMTLSLSFDHRLLDGAEAGRALRAVADVLENPFKLGALAR